MEQIVSQIYQQDNVVVVTVRDPVWETFEDELRNTKGQPRQMKDYLTKANTHLSSNKYFNREQLGLDDLHIWLTLLECGRENKAATAIVNQFVNVKRWKNDLGGFKTLSEIENKLNPKKENKKSKATTNDLLSAVELKDADKVEMVVTRFTPSTLSPDQLPLISCTKRLFLNYYYAEKYGGKMLIRFDDTNPVLLREGYETAILQDLATLGIPTEGRISYMSDYFDVLEQYAIQLINQGHAYVDSAPSEQIRQARLNGEITAAYGNTISENLRLFEEMRKGTEEGINCVLRARINDSTPMANRNKAMCDPCIYRTVTCCNHIRTGTKYQIYPLYDFACPIVDSIGGVTHAIRPLEFWDKNPFYLWVQETCGLRKCYLSNISQLTLSHTVMTKKKLLLLIQRQIVSGWDDPSMPTIRGFLRHGLMVEALRMLMIMLAPSRSTMVDINKLWAWNKECINPVAGRYTAIERDGAILTIANFPTDHPHSKALLLQPNHKLPALGERLITFSDSIMIDRLDADSLVEGEEIALLNWSNLIIKQVVRDENQRAISITGELNLAGNYKSTKKRLSWIDYNGSKINIICRVHHNLLTVPSYLPDHQFEDILTPQLVDDTEMTSDASILAITKGQIIQFVKRGFFICDVPYGKEDTPPIFIAIPDGR